MCSSSFFLQRSKPEKIFSCERFRTRCSDCGKPSMPHMYKNSYDHELEEPKICCWCFHFKLDNKVWHEVTFEYYQKTKIKNNGMLCLYCVRKRLGRDMKVSDFHTGQYGFYASNEESFKDCVDRMVAYANAEENTSLLL